MNMTKTYCGDLHFHESMFMKIETDGNEFFMVFYVNNFLGRIYNSSFLHLTENLPTEQKETLKFNETKKLNCLGKKDDAINLMTNKTRTHT